jgi:hypothetical protein
MVRGRLGEGVCAFRFNLLDPSSESSERKTREMYLRAKCGCLLEFHRLTVAYVGMGKKTRRGRRSIVISTSETSCMLNIAKGTNQDMLRSAPPVRL